MANPEFSLQNYFRIETAGADNIYQQISIHGLYGYNTSNAVQNGDLDLKRVAAEEFRRELAGDRNIRLSEHLGTGYIAKIENSIQLAYSFPDLKPIYFLSSTLTGQPKGEWTTSDSKQLRDSLALCYGGENTFLNNIPLESNPTFEIKMSQIKVFDKENRPTIHLREGSTFKSTIEMSGRDDKYGLRLMYGVKDLPDFESKYKGWGNFLETTINSIAKIKGIPQGGRLTLEPESFRVK